MDKARGQLLDRLGHTFSDIRLYEQALTHRSFDSAHNERLEYLGDAILGLVIAQELYERFTAADEGELSRLRANLVKGEVLAELAIDFELGECLSLGNGEKINGGTRRASILAGTIEALIGAIFLDSGFDDCRRIVLQWFKSRIDNVSLAATNKDAKTRLQEYLQKTGRDLPVYEVIEAQGEAHRPIFLVRCSLRESRLNTVGRGGSRKKAEQAAASTLLDKLIEA